jgi:hypothetical protein
MGIEITISKHWGWEKRAFIFSLDKPEVGHLPLIQAQYDLTPVSQ